MRRTYLALLFVVALTIPFACSEPDNTGSGSGTEQGDNQTGGDDDGNDNGGDDVVTYAVGDYYKQGLAEGIVAYVDESGEHGLIVSIDEATLQWATDYDMLTIEGGEFSMEDGSRNCKYIREQEDWERIYPAVAWCHAKNALGLSSWYLPAIYELETVYTGLEAINATLTKIGATPLSTGVNDSYWSSTEIGPMGAYAFSFHYGEIASYDYDKLNTHQVRAVRKF